MKVVQLREAKNALSAFVDEAQGGRILITRHGRPAALLVGVEGADLEDLMTATDPAFWKMIEASRRDTKGHSSAEVRALFEPQKKTSARSAKAVAVRGAKKRPARSASAGAAKRVTSSPGGPAGRE